MVVSQFLIIAGLILINGFFVTVEFALVKVRTTQIDQLAEEGNWAAKLTSKALDRLDFYLSASQIGITVASLALGYGDEHVGRADGRVGSDDARASRRPSVVGLRPCRSRRLAGRPLAGDVPAHGAGRASPQEPGDPVGQAICALDGSRRWSILSYVFSPVIWLLNKASNLTLWVLGLGQTDHAELAHSEEELRLIVAESVAGGHLSRNERMMIENVLNLEEKTARRVMVPRPDIVYLSLARPLEDNLRLARQAGHTRFPLCEDDLSTVIGMIHVKDIFRAGRPPERPARPAPARAEGAVPARDAPARPALARISAQPGSPGDAARRIRQRRRHGRRLENVLEELVGPIQDEFDRETPQITPLGDNVYEVDAACPLDVLAETCGLEVPETDAETAGGLVLDLLGRLAKPGDSVTVDGHRLTVLGPTRPESGRSESSRRFRARQLADAGTKA